MEKTAIVATLGERKLVLPQMVNAALAANDRLKYLLTLLQFARQRADHPGIPVMDLQAERLRVALEEPWLDLVVEGTTLRDDGTYAVPRLGALLERLLENLHTMLAPLLVADDGHDGAGRSFSSRLEALCDDEITSSLQSLDGEQIDRLTHGQRERGDSVHLLVMDMHRALNRLQESLASETIAGARTYDLAPEDRPLVESFMRGVVATSALRFDHPGLGTTATRAGERLLLQNDIGTTDAHVVVMEVTGLRLSITYTDVHLPRLVFFEDLFDGVGIQWADSRAVQDASMEDGMYHVATGTLEVADRATLCAALERVGSRLVFLIDWNRARKRLRMLVGKREAVELLQWAAEVDVGHMGFLRCGGEQMIFAAIEFAAAGQLRPGQKLEDLVGRDRALRFMRYSIRQASEGLRRGESPALIADEVRTELLRHVKTRVQSLFGLASDHAGLVVEIADELRAALYGVLSSRPADRREALGARAKRWESAADEILAQARALQATSTEGLFLKRFLEHLDDVADELEEASFCFTLVQTKLLAREASEALAALGDQVVRSARELLKAIETVRALSPVAIRDDVEDFLQSTYRIATLEHATDETRRRVMAVLARSDLPSGQTYVVSDCAARLERAADGLLHRALELRDHVMRELTSRSGARAA